MKKAHPRKRDLEATRREILGVAFVEVFSRGFQGVSVDEIVQKTSLTKGAFYHHFPTKLDMGYALVDEVVKPMIIERWIRPLEEFENPVEGILERLRALIGDASPGELKRGCPLNNLVQEMSSVDAGFKRRLQAALGLWVDEMEKQMERARKAGYLRRDADPRKVAYFVVMAHEGFYGMLKALDGPEPFSALYDSLRAFLGSVSDGTR